jgi:tetratricopeptide (TPR) repeat protein
MSYHLKILSWVVKDKGEYRPAIQSLLEGNKIYDSDTQLLNALGFCFYKTGQKKDALNALNASLRLNPEQPDIKELVARVEKELK